MSDFAALGTQAGTGLQQAYTPDAMRHCDILIAPRWCAPVEPPNVILEDHCVVVNDGRITDVLPRAKASAMVQPSIVVERAQHILIPGLVNAHTHAAMSLMRGIADDMPLASWLKSGVWPIEQRWMGAELVRDGTELAVAEMISGGTTCFGDQYYFPEIVAETAVDLGMRAVVGTPVIEFATAWADSVGEYISRGAERVHDPYADHPLVSSCFAPHSTSALSDEGFLELRVIADQLDVRTQIHLHETRAEIRHSIERFGRRPVERLRDLGLVNSSLLAVHAVHLNDDEINWFADSGVSIAHCPRSNLKLGSGIAPVTAYREAGINVATGTDGAASNNRLDMLGEMQLACLLAKGESQDATSVSAFDALKMATLDGAAALGLAHETGSINPASGPTSRASISATCRASLFTIRCPS